MFAFTPAVKNLLIITVGLHILLWLLESQMGENLSIYLALFPITSPNFQPYQVFTTILTHVDVGHLFGNMIGLFFFGPMLERALGSQRFLVFYVISGVCAALMFMGVSSFESYQVDQRRQAFVANPNPNDFRRFILEEVPGGYQGFTDPNAIYDFASKEYAANPNDEQYIERAKEIVNNYTDYAERGTPLMGASGAVFAILMGCFLLFPNRQVQMIIPPIPMKIKYIVALYACFEAYELIERNPTDNVAHLAHLGGMLFAYILIRYWKIPSEG